MVGGGCMGENICWCCVVLCRMAAVAADLDAGSC